MATASTQPPNTEPQRALTPLQNKFGTLKNMLETKNVLTQIERALPNAISPDRFLRIALTELRINPTLLMCTPESVIGSIIQSAQLGLELDRVLGQAYLIPYKNNEAGTWECQFQPGYRGYIQLSRNSGEIKSLGAQVVHDGERFAYEHGTEPFLRHQPNDEYEETPISHVYAVVHYTNGGFDFEVMSKAGVEKIRSRSRAPNSPAWTKDWSEMAKAKVLRRLAKRLPGSAQNSALVKAAALDEATDAGVPQNNGALLEVDEQGNVNVPPPEKAVGHDQSLSGKATDKLNSIAQQFPKSEGNRGVTTVEASRPPQGSEKQNRPSPASPSPSTSVPQDGVPLDFD
jgi:recombination protein RecT